MRKTKVVTTSQHEKVRNKEGERRECEKYVIK